MLSKLSKLPPEKKKLALRLLNWLLKFKIFRKS